ncbi:MAG TPA: hypothetical protein VN889_03950 [Solirubrobacteraceae bacterium]|nr:hypothetical protein [Solirubrobacteraceae bacterium]
MAIGVAVGALATPPVSADAAAVVKPPTAVAAATAIIDIFKNGVRIGVGAYGVS